jgi:Flp pilus assembly protein TadG
VIWRLRLMLEGKRRRILIGAAVLAALLAAAAGAAFALTRDDDSSSSGETTQTQRRSVTFYLQALAPKTTVNGCTMRIAYTWRPHFQANRYIGEPAVIQVTGPGIAGTYRKPFTARGLTLEPAPVSLAGGYVVWAATVLSIGGDAPANTTTIQAAPPRNVNC